MSPDTSNVDLLIESVRALRAEMADLQHEAREINAQCKITNGRVTNLELDRVAREAILKYRKEVSGASTTIKVALLCAILSGPVTAVVVFVLTLVFG